MKNISYILFFFVLSFQVSYTQEFLDDDFDELVEEIQETDGDKTSTQDLLEKLENLNDYIENNGDEEEDEDDFSSEYYSNQHNENESQKKYLNSPIEKKTFSRSEWDRIRRNVVDDVLEDRESRSGGQSDNSYSGESSPYGDREMIDRDNPYQQSEKNYQKYWDEQKKKNASSIKRKQREIKPNKNRPKRNAPDLSGFSVSPMVGKVLLILVVIILAVLIFYLFFKAPIEKKSQKIVGDIADIPPTEIPKSELELRLEKAIAAKDYRKAIRIYFIFIIRGLSENDSIKWEKEKTNFAYLVEMRKNKFYNEFESSVSIYEIVWYGKRILDETTYKEVEPNFKNLIQKIES